MCKDSDYIKLYYFKHPNLGDKMNELFIEKLFNRKVQFADCLSAEMMAIGSILDDIILENGQQMKSPPYPIKVWGTGLVSSTSNIKLLIV